MAPPKKKIEPKPREKLWTETLIGFVLFVGGLTRWIAFWRKGATK